MSEFLRPKLNGARFKGGAIPLDMLGEIQALGEMMVAVAKWRYLQDHPNRKRIPSVLLRVRPSGWLGSERAA